MKEVLSEDWISYNVTIEKKGEEVSPWDIIDVIQNDTVIKDLNEKVCDVNDVRWMICILLSSSRLMGLTVDSYTDALKTRILGQMRVLGCRLGAFPPKTLYETWILDESYTKMLAAIDMFLNKFPSHADSCMRICTLRSRFKEYSALLSIGYICNLLSLDEECKVVDWLYTEKLAFEMILMLKDTQEILEAYSYFPYQSNLKVVQKSFYSASKTPHSYFVFHSVGTLLQSTKSKNAKHMSGHNILNNINNAKLMAYAFSSSIKLEKAIKIEGHKIGLEDTSEVIDGDDAPSK